MKINFMKLETEIQDILIKNPITRNDDHMLYVIYWRNKAPQVSFFEFWKNPKKYNASQFSAVERCRRKIQARRPELRDSEVADARLEKTLEYESYAIN